MELSAMNLPICLLSICLLYLNASSIQPKKAERNTNSQVDVKCSTQNSTPITDCHFKAWFDNEDIRHEAIVLDLGNGNVTGPVDLTSPANELLFTTAYSSQGLDQGQCVLTMKSLAPGRYLVGCRIKSDTSDWTYEHMALVVHASRITETTDNKQRNFPNYVWEQKQDSGTLDFSSDEPVQACQLFLPHHSPVTLDSANPSASTSTYHAELQGSNCSVTLFNLDVNATGIVWCFHRERDDATWKAFDPVLILVEDSRSESNFVFTLILFAIIATILYAGAKKAYKTVRSGSCEGNAGRTHMVLGEVRESLL